MELSRSLADHRRLILRPVKNAGPNRARRLRRSRERAERSSGKTRGRRGGHFTILDPGAFGSAVKREVENRYEGHVPRAAAALGISRQTLTRLMTGTATRITVPTFERINSLLANSPSDSVGSVLPSEGQQAFVAYWLWLRSSFNRVLRDHGAGSAVAVTHQEGDWRGRATEWEALLNRTRRVAPDVLTAINAIAAERKFLVDRLHLVIVRLLEPLLESYSSGGVERYHVTLTDDELADFIRAGLRREMILLNRENDIGRAQRAKRLVQRDSSADSANAIIDSLDTIVPGRRSDSEPRDVLSNFIRELS